MATIQIHSHGASPAPSTGIALFSVGFRPFFLLGAAWSALALPIWLGVYTGRIVLPSTLAPTLWHVHEMIFGFAFAIAAGFLLTAIPNWTGRLPLKGAPLASLAALWLAGRFAVLYSGVIGPHAAAIVDIAFPVAFVIVIARELVAGRNWRNLPMLVALSLLACGSTLVHLEAIGYAMTAPAGNRLGIATILLLIALIGGRIVPSFTRNWLAKARPDGRLPAQAGRLDMAALLVTVSGLIAWVVAPQSAAAPWMELAAGIAAAVRLSRWCGLSTLREPLVFILHVGYGWLALGLMLLGVNGLEAILPATTALHALTAGAIGTMTLAVMTRATLGHSGQALTAGGGTVAIYVLVTLSALLRLAAPLAGGYFLPMTWIAGAAWSGAFGLFVLLFGNLLVTRRKPS
jgi:uncharacterized protein involved in response to NO